ncbi:MAG: hypothetical protein ABR91_02780 [Polaribacter sp. BACL8 MAG-120531-bin13]|nr:MAG: hypothetical protein ABR91_02780 [Polaribacter sp. BACL8 MAG-120531-bin13]KRP14149.1 MAG: hypothetical protein ABR93_03420 [Polaribacter sp. BACL8 MAG-120419-bin8]
MAKKTPNNTFFIYCKCYLISPSTRFAARRRPARRTGSVTATAPYIIRRSYSRSAVSVARAINARSFYRTTLGIIAPSNRTYISNTICASASCSIAIKITRSRR